MSTNYFSTQGWRAGSISCFVEVVFLIEGALAVKKLDAMTAVAEGLEVSRTRDGMRSHDASISSHGHFLYSVVRYQIAFTLESPPFPPYHTYSRSSDSNVDPGNHQR